MLSARPVRRAMTSGTRRVSTARAQSRPALPFACVVALSRSPGQVYWSGCGDSSAAAGQGRCVQIALWCGGPRPLGRNPPRVAVQRLEDPSPSTRCRCTVHEVIGEVAPCCAPQHSAASPAPRRALWVHWRFAVMRALMWSSPSHVLAWPASTTITGTASHQRHWQPSTTSPPPHSPFHRSEVDRPRVPSGCIELSGAQGAGPSSRKRRSSEPELRSTTHWPRCLSSLSARSGPGSAATGLQPPGTRPACSEPSTSQLAPLP